MAKPIDASDHYVREWLPGGTVRGSFLLMHGVESHSGWFAELASLLAADGWAVLAPDRPGWGQSPGTRGHLESYRDALSFLVKSAEDARKRFGTVHLAGLSWGGLLALYAALRRGYMFDSVTLLAPGIAAQRGFGIASQFGVAWSHLAGHSEKTYELAFSPEHFTARPDRQSYINRDPLRMRAISASFCVETLKMRQFVREKAGLRRLPPSLCLLAADDTIVNNARTGDICRQAGMQVEVIPNTAHSLVFECPDYTARRMGDFAADAGQRPSGGKVWVYGAGAVGGMIGSLLALGGHGVTLKARRQGATRIQRNGVRLNCPEGGRWIKGNLSAATDVSRLPPPDLLVMAVKSYDTEAALLELHGLIGPATTILSLQNGLQNEGRIAAAFPDNPIIAGAICASLEPTGPGEVFWADDRGGVAAARYYGDPFAAREAWERFLPASGLETLWVSGTNAATKVKWSKLLLNLAFNALNAALGLSAQEILAQPGLGNLAAGAMKEGCRVMRKQGIAPVDLPGYPLSWFGSLSLLPTFILREIMALQSRRSVGAASSTRSDLLKNKEITEIDELNGAVVREGKTVSVATPYNNQLVSILKAALRL